MTPEQRAVLVRSVARILEEWRAKGSLGVTADLAAVIVDDIEPFVAGAKAGRGHGRVVATSPQLEEEVVGLLKQLPRLRYNEIGGRVGLTGAIVQRIERDYVKAQR